MWLLRVVVSAAVAGVCALPGCDPGEPGVDAEPVRRTVSVAWKVTDPGGTELACEQVDAQFVTVSFFRTRTGEGFTEVFDCTRKSGTRTLEDGEYTIGFELADRFGTLATRPFQRHQVAGDLALDEVAFPIDPTGGLVLALDTAMAANCGGPSQITGMSISLFDAAGACVMTTLAIEGAGPYATTCAVPASTACIEKDRAVTATGLPAGEYRIRAVGLHGAMPCWEHDQRHRVRAAGLSRALVLPLRKTCN
jgi:hypothetical protein